MPIVDIVAVVAISEAFVSETLLPKATGISDGKNLPLSQETVQIRRIISGIIIRFIFIMVTGGGDSTPLRLKV
jgi:hypothetical protein